MGVIRVVVGGTLSVELDWPNELLNGVLNRELERLLVLSEEELGETVSGITGTLLDSEELEDVSVVLKVNWLLGSETRLEENVELRFGDELGLVVGEGTSLIDDEDEVVVKNVVVVVVVGKESEGVEGMEIKVELEVELGGAGGV